MQKRKFIYALILFIFLFALFSVSSFAATDDGSGIFVGGVKVTSQNQDDILGDGTAKYDPQTLTLTIENFTAENVVRLGDGGSNISDNAFSVYVGIQNRAVTVIIKGNCYFSGGVVNAIGKIRVEDAKVTFAPSVPTCLMARSGAIEILDSKIKMEGLNFIGPIFSQNNMGVAFFANQIGIENSRFELDMDQCETYNLNRLEALFYAIDNAVFDNCRFEVHTPFPVFYSVFRSRSGALLFSDCRFDFSGQLYCFLAQGQLDEGQEKTDSTGVLMLDGCRVRAKNSYYLLGAVELQLLDSSVNAECYSGGIALSSTNEKDQYFIKDSRIKLRGLTIEEKEKNLWRPFWRMMTDSDKAVYGSYDAFVLASGQSEAQNKSQSFGIFAQNGVTYFEESRISIKGFDFGFLATGEALAKCLEGVTLDLEAEEAAFLMFSVFENAFQYDVEMNFGKHELQYVSLPIGSNTEAVGTTVFGMVLKGYRMILNEEKEFATMQEVLEQLIGYEAKVKVRSEGAFNPAVIVVPAALAAIAIATGLVYVLLIRKKTKEQN